MTLNLFLDLFLLLGIMFLVAVIIVWTSFKKKKEKCNQIVEAVIVKINKVERSESGSDPMYVSYFPIYEYEYMGKVYRKGSNVGNLKNTFEIGKKVHIYVNPENPEKIYEDSAVPKMVVGIFGIIGVILVVASVLGKIMMSIPHYLTYSLK